MKKKKKKKRSKYICYLEDLRRWVTAPELLAYHEQVIREIREGPIMEDIPLLTEAVFQFLEDEGGFVTPVAQERGWYLGLVTFLLGEGFKREKVVLEMMKGTFLFHIQKAWKIYRKKHPPRITKWEKDHISPTGEYIAEPIEKKRPKIFNHPTTAVIRWMGTDCWDFDEAKTALTEMGADVSDITIRIQLRAGKTGDRGPPAKLTDEEINTLYECLAQKS